MFIKGETQKSLFIVSDTYWSVFSLKSCLNISESKVVSRITANKLYHWACQRNITENIRTVVSDPKQQILLYLGLDFPEIQCKILYTIRYKGY